MTAQSDLWAHIRGKVLTMSASTSEICLEFRELVDRLPRRPQQPTLQTPQGEALSVTPSRAEGYVEPSFVEVEWPADAAVLLVEAAGAVGKSAAAAALAEVLHAPLVLAEKAQVGSYTLSGLVQDALGFTSDFVPAVSNGEAVLVVDSLDEAHLKAGTQNFLSFLENVQSISGARTSVGSRRASVIVFSRSDTAELVRLAFAAEELPLAHVRLDFFGEAAASAFIRSYLDLRHKETGRGEYTVHLASPRPYSQLRDARLQQLAQSVARAPVTDLSAQWTKTKDFLGYAPVLIAVAESLAVTNPAREAMQLVGDINPTDLLVSIVERVMAREQQKVAQLADQLRARSSVDDAELLIEDLFTPQEQLLRVAGLVLQQDLLVSYPPSLPSSVRQDYEERATQWTADHPFVRNRQFASVVFQDYVLAHGALSTAARASLQKPVESCDVKIGPFFSHFAHRALSDYAVPAVRESVLEWLLQSWLEDAQLAGDRTGEAFLELLEESGRLSLWRDTAGAATLDFEVHELSGAFQLRSSCSNLTLTSRAGVVLGDRRMTLTLGPGLAVVAGELVIEAETLSVESRAGGRGVVLAAPSVTANYLNNVRAVDIHDLRLYAPEPPPRLRPFMTSLNTQGVGIEYHEYMNLRALLMAFGSSVRGGPAVFGEKLDQAIVKDNAHRRAVLDRLMAVGAVLRDGALYRLDLKALSELRFGLADIKSGEPSTAVLAFLADVKRG